MSKTDNYSDVSVLDLKRGSRNANTVLNALRINPRISSFSISENIWLANIINKLIKDGLIIQMSELFPVSRYSLTKSGIDFITV